VTHFVIIKREKLTLWSDLAEGIRKAAVITTRKSSDLDEVDANKQVFILNSVCGVRPVLLRR